MTSLEKYDFKTSVCCSCQKEKPIDHFWRNSNNKSGYDGKCKFCRIKGSYCKKKPKQKNSVGKPKKIDGPQLMNCTKKDWTEMFLFLKKIGYNLSGDKTIHEQFCEKHNLKPRKRMYERSIQFTAKDLGLV